MKHLLLGSGFSSLAHGGKAHKLDQMKKWGLPIPSGFILEHPIPLDSLEKILGVNNDSLKYAVRSSGQAEDLEGASFAGLYETYLDCMGVTHIHEAIQSCFNSIQADRVKKYLEEKKLSHLDLKMSVLVQEMVPAKWAGVLFTLPPMTGKEEHFYLEVVAGLGEQLVSGHITPSSYTWNWQENRLVTKNINSISDELKEEHLIELARLGSTIQSHYGQPQDIEWAIDQENKVWILQTRPITHFEPRTDIDEHTDADFKDGGISARVCTPLMYSIYESALEYSMGNYLKKIRIITSDDNIKWISYFYGRAYWNAGAVKEALAQLPDFDESTFDQDLGIVKDYGMEGPRKTSITPLTLLRALPVINSLKNEYKDCLDFNHNFKQWFEKKDEYFKRQIILFESMSDVEFLKTEKKVFDFQWLTECAYFRTIYNNSNLQGEFKKYLIKIDPGKVTDVLVFLGSLGNLSHMKIQNDLVELKKCRNQFGINHQSFKNLFQSFIESHYHHGDVELDLTVPRWGEDVGRIYELIENTVIHEIKLNESNDFDVELEKLDKTKGLLWRIYGRSVFLKKLNAMRIYLREREDMRSFSTRAYYLLRKVILERKRRFKQNNIFFFRKDEILNNKMEFSDEVEKRKKIYESYANFQPPHEFGGRIYKVKKIGKGDLVGVPCSSGIYQGRAFVAHNLKEAEKISKEDILVTPYTDPGWTPILARVSGVITEVGGVLSHAAVIGREYKIPAILNVNQATRRIQTGDILRIDGKQGTIEILKKGS